MILDVNELNFNKYSSESDVEQMFIMPLLTSKAPYGMGLSNSNILTQANINRFTIGKGSDEKIYYPDYILVYQSYPIAIIEAKKPSDMDVASAYREARLYATEINDRFPKGQAPVKYLLATNGINLMFGVVGTTQPDINCKVADLTYGSKNLTELIDRIGPSGLEKQIKNITKGLTPPFIKKPREIIGGKSVQEKEIKKNPLGETIRDSYYWVFNPDNETERKYIVSNGYIATKLNKRNKYEIDQLVRLSSSASELISTEIKNTGKPVEIYSVLSEKSHNQIVLLIGKVGVGKSTFIDYLQYTDAIPQDIQKNLIWIRLNLNNAPLSKEEIYSWMQNQIITILQQQFSNEFDFDSLEFLLKLYAVEVNSYNKGIGSLYDKNSIQYKTELAELLKNLQSNLDKTLQCYIRYLANERGRSLILVFDNCDKKNKDSQLLMFEVANWAKDSLKSIIFLPLRDETYDNYKDEKPLDTAIKQYSFRIESPRFQDVLIRRVQLALDLISSQLEDLKPQQSEIRLKNDMYVRFDPSNDGSTYLLSILNSVLNNENSIRRLLTGLSGGNIRIALEMFLNFCSSGHIPNEELIKIRQHSDTYTMPNHIAVRALMRGDRRYYISKFSNIINLFDAEITDENIPIYLIRLSILRWLKMMVRTDSKKSTRKGYFPVEEILENLSQLGFPENLTINQIGYLAKAMCIVTEDFEYNNIQKYTNIKIAPAGYAHLELLENDITYLATVAEDTRIVDKNLVYEIKNTIASDIEKSFKLSEVYDIASKIVNYMDKIVENMIETNHIYSRNNDLESLISMQKPKETIERFRHIDSSDNNRAVLWTEFCEQYPIGTIIKGTVKSKVHYGYFVTLNLDPKYSIDGLIHNSNISNTVNLNVGDNISVKIDQHNPQTVDRVSLVICIDESS